MSGRNIFLVIMAAIVAVGVYMLVMAPGETPVIPVESPALVAPRTAPPASPTIEPRVEPAPALDDVANDAAAEAERLKKEQDEMNEKPPETMPGAAQPEMR